VSVTGSTLGKRGDRIVCDDLLEPEKGIPTEGELRGIKEWFWKVLFPVLEPGGKICCVGTRFHALDIYGELLTRGWSSIVQSALVENKETGQEESAWPERFSTQELLKRRESMGSIIFSLQYQNNADISSKLQMEFLHMITEDNIPNDLVIYQGVDPCLAKGPNPDYFAIATIGVSEKTGKGYLLDLVRGRLGFHQQMDVIRKQAAIWNPRKIGIETNAAQAFMKEQMTDADFVATREDEDLQPHQDKPKKKLRKRMFDIPLISVPSKGSKINRILAMSAMFESGLIQIKAYKDESGLLPIPQLEPFVSEWLTFPNGRNDDAIDAVAICTRMAEFGMPQPISLMQEAADDKPYYTRRSRISLFHR
jgi:phage terminase large subunit-like protein